MHKAVLSYNIENQFKKVSVLSDTLLYKLTQTLNYVLCIYLLSNLNTFCIFQYKYIK